MIDGIISILVASGTIANVEIELKTCFNSLGGVFEVDDSRYKLRSSYLSGDLESSINLVLTPDDFFENLFYLENELADIWYTLNGLHHFQMSQFFRYREATVLRFVTTIFTGSAVTGSMYIAGDKYLELVAKYEREQHKLDSWVDSKQWARFEAQK